MRTSFKTLLGFVAMVCALATGPAAAQTITTGTIAGVVSDAQGGVLPGATVVALHTPTGTGYESVTGSDGRFRLLNVRAGGPYTITVTMAGFKDEKLDNVQANLGQEQQLTFTMQLATLTETIEVTGQSAVMDTSRAGAASNVQEGVIETLPTIARSLNDFARTSPYFSLSSLNEDPNAISVAGQNNRYNNVQVDGAVNNDLFGLAASGTPGGQTETQPVSLDAIQELQLVVSAYDVRQGGFAGGGMNAITKSGTNAIRGTGYYYGRNDALVGKGPLDRAFGEFKDYQFGASIGGPIRQNKAFYFGNVELGRRDQPSGISVAGSGQPFGREAEVDRFLSIIQSRYGFTPGSKDEFTRTTNNNKFFVRGDVNVATNHQFTVRHNYIDAINDIGRPDTNNFYFDSSFYQITDTTNSTVFQLNSTFGRAVNEFRLTYQRIRDRRGGQPDFEPFPLVRVDVSGGGQIRAGTENFSTANELDQDIVELTNDYTMLRGAHTFTLGTHNEFFKFRNLFIRDNFGNYRFSSLDNFERGVAQSYDYSFSATADPKQAAKFSVRQLGFYAGDTWRMRPRFTLTYGVRVDLPIFPDKPTANPASVEHFGYATNVVPENQLWSPRAGFNYDIRGNGQEQVRGGVGLFSGRTPYVWLSNQYGNTGIEFTRLSVSFRATNNIPFVADPNNQPKTVPNVTVATNEIDLIDPDYTFPQLIRGNLAYDRQLAWGLVGTAEFLFSTSVKDIKYQNLNYIPIGTAPDGRPLHGRKVPTLSDVIFLTNTDQGNQWSMAFKVERPFRGGLFWSASYLYGVSKSIMDGTSSQAASNWGNVYVPGDSNNPPLTMSNFSPGHKITLAASYDFRLPKGFTTTTSLFYSGQSGRPYSLAYNGDPNGDNRFFNDLQYIPASADEVIFANGTFDDYMAFINSEGCLADFIGQIHERNACRAPWSNQLDFRVAFGMPVGPTKVDLTFDVMNLLNLFDNTAGLIEYANFNELTDIRYSVVGGKPRYDIGGITRSGYQKFLRDDLKSRWQAQFGARVRF